MSAKRSRLPLEVYTFEEMLEFLVLHKSTWALEIDDTRYSFDPELTRKEVEDVIRAAYEAYQTRFN